MAAVSFIFPLMMWNALGFPVGKVQLAKRKEIDLSKQRNFFQGDIMLPRTRSGLTNPGRKWTDGIVPYEISGNFTDEEKEQIETAMKSIEIGTCIKFVPRDDEYDYVDIQSIGAGCFSNFGRRFLTATQVNLQNWGDVTCMCHRNIVHELLHAVGLEHEHSRPDRDKYIIIHEANVDPDLMKNFKLVNAITYSDFGVPYDYTSVMHYSKTAFSENGEITMEPVDRNYLDIIGRVSGMSPHDILKVNRMYNCHQAPTEYAEEPIGY